MAVKKKGGRNSAPWKPGYKIGPLGVTGVTRTGYAQLPKHALNEADALPDVAGRVLGRDSDEFLQQNQGVYTVLTNATRGAFQAVLK
jgi:hypothetical protein